jgi:hypothetical protein
MPKLQILEFNGVSYDTTWAVPFASGGLTELSLVDCPNLGPAVLDALLAFHSDTLRFLELVYVPVGTGQVRRLPRRQTLARGPRYKLNKLESLRITNIGASKEYLRRFSSSPVEFLAVTKLRLLSSVDRANILFLTVDWVLRLHRWSSPLGDNRRVVISEAQNSDPGESRHSEASERKR